MQSCEMAHRPYNAAIIPDSSQLVVTLPGIQSLQYVDTVNWTPGKQVQTRGYCWGISIRSLLKHKALDCLTPSSFFKMIVFSMSLPSNFSWCILNDPNPATNKIPRSSIAKPAGEIRSFVEKSNSYISFIKLFFCLRMNALLHVG
jgi:hypothetical protein